MNEFIKFRNLVYEANNSVYPFLFLENYIIKSKTINTRELINQIRIIKQIEFEKKLGEKEIGELCSILGNNSYVDRFIIDIILKLFNDDIKVILKKKIEDLISQKQYNNQKLYHVLDISIECDLDVLSDSELLFMLQEYKLDFDLVSILTDYMDHFKRQGFKSQLSKLLTLDYPDNIKIQLLNLLKNLYSLENLDKSFLKHHVIDEKNKVFYDHYLNFSNLDLKFEKQGISILQSMFYGDFEDSGKGNNGGLAVLLKDLGEEISKDTSVAYVFTITITQELNKPFISYYDAKHLFIRLPIYLDQSVSDEFIKRELFIKRYIRNFLKQSEIKPDVFHIRYLDNASKAVAELCKELNKKLVFTLTPDPHRNMFDKSGQLKELKFNELVEKLNKIKIGDELIYLSDGIIGIGDTNVKKELDIYFPQFKDESINKKIKMISEGIQIDKSLNVLATDIYSNLLIELSETNRDFFKKPIILNVGRLSVLKGQIELLKAWSNSKLSDTHNLLIIGGDYEKPNKEEKMIIDFFKSYLQKSPEFKGRFIHKGAMSNMDIRLLQKGIIKKDLNYPHIYLCSSVKEEFGIAILEAMSKGFLTLGPTKGGVKTYMRHGENGFLIDTSNWETIAKEAENHIYDSKMDITEFKKIQAAGRKTVDENFSVKKISKEFVSFYLSLKGEKDYEI